MISLFFGKEKENTYNISDFLRRSCDFDVRG